MDQDFSTTSGADAGGGGGGWIKLHFAETHFVSKIIIYYRFYTNWFDPHNTCVRNEEAFRGCASNDDNVDVSVYQGETKQKFCGTLQLTDGLEQSDQIYTLICNAEGDTVVMSKDSGVIALYEVVVVTHLGKFNINSYSSSQILKVHSSRGIGIPVL